MYMHVVIRANIYIWGRTRRFFVNYFEWQLLILYFLRPSIFLTNSWFIFPYSFNILFCICNIFINYSSVDGCLGWFYFLAIMDIQIPLYVWAQSSLGIWLGVKYLGHTVVLVLIIWGPSKPISRKAVRICTPPAVNKNCTFPISSLTFGRILDDSHADQSEVSPFTLKLNGCYE